MNIRQTLAQVANELDSLGMYPEADAIDGVLQQLDENMGEHRNVTPDDIFEMPNAEQIISEARSWVKDNQWEEDEEDLDYYSSLIILKGVENHYDGGLSQFLRDNNLMV